jgi:hypothetical protein
LAAHEARPGGVAVTQPEPPKPEKTLSEPQRFEALRLVQRLFLVLGILATVAAWRLDQAVSTAYRTEWVADKFVQRQEASLFGCEDCWRLPNRAGLWATAIIGAGSILLLLVAAVIFQYRNWNEKGAQHEKGAQRSVFWVSVETGLAVIFQYRNWNEKGAQRSVFFWVKVETGLITALAIADGVVRYVAARGEDASWIAVGTVLNTIALALLALIVIAAAAGSSMSQEGPYTLVERAARFLFRQRVNVLALVLLTAALLFVAQSSGQAIDSIRTWTLFDSAHSTARLGFGIGATLLLSVVIYESAVQLTQVSNRDRDTWRLFPKKAFLRAGLLLLLIGILLVAEGPFGYGLIAIASLGLLLWLLDLPEFARRAAEAKDEAETEKKYDARIAEILAIAPLLLFAATGVAAAIDAALSRGRGNALGPLVPTAIRQPRRFDVPGWKSFMGAAAVGVATAIVFILLDSDFWAAVLALGGCVAVLAYIVWLLHIQPPKEEDPDACCPALSLPIAILVGLGLLVAVHWETFGSTNTIGTLSLVSFALAFWIAILNFFIFGTFHIRPPSALARLGFARLPVLTLVAIAWIAAGAIRPPPTLHEVRLTGRHAIATNQGSEVIPNAPTLSDAFNTWVRAQPEPIGETPDAQQPMPMFLVAAHGGGIRAAYWTALALDCLVGVSTAEFNPLTARTEPGRKATCESRRRTRLEQQAAARRIFLASGVSGGAVGLYAYARQLIAAGWLEDGSWVDDRLGGDFASATVGWAMFHDVTNHWFGLNSHRGGDCALALGSVCFTADRAAIHEQAFDKVWPEGQFPPLLRLAWDLRSSTDEDAQAVARTVPLLITNATVTGGKARGVISAANLGAWPNLDAYDAGRGNFDTHPLAGTVEVVEVACATKDLALSTAALLGSRFPYVSPSGHVSGQCRRSEGQSLEADRGSPCASVRASICEMRLVDGGYAENSGLFTIDALWPSIRQLVVGYNRKHRRKIAPVIVELDNHYQVRLEAQLSASGMKDETTVPLLTAFGARNSMQTFARALAYRLRPPGCTVTISPGLHPGLTAPLGWELSEGARDDLRVGLTRPHPTEVGRGKERVVLDLRRMQLWLGAEGTSAELPPDLTDCIPKEKSPTLP